MPVARGNANSLVKEFMAFQTLWESQKNDPKSDTVCRCVQTKYNDDGNLSICK